MVEGEGAVCLRMGKGPGRRWMIHFKGKKAMSLSTHLRS